MLLVMIVRGQVGVLGRLRGVAGQPRLVQATVWMGQLRMRRRHRRDARMRHQARMVGVVQVSGLPPHVVPVGLQEAQLRVVEDVKVGAAQAVTRRANEEVSVVFAGLPPDREVEGGPAQLEAGREQRVTENLKEGRRCTKLETSSVGQTNESVKSLHRSHLLSDLAQQLNAI